MAADVELDAASPSVWNSVKQLARGLVLARERGSKASRRRFWMRTAELEEQGIYSQVTREEDRQGVRLQAGSGHVSPCTVGHG